MRWHVSGEDDSSAFTVRLSPWLVGALSMSAWWTEAGVSTEKGYEDVCLPESSGLRRVGTGSSTGGSTETAKRQGRAGQKLKSVQYTLPERPGRRLPAVARWAKTAGTEGSFTGGGGDGSDCMPLESASEFGQKILLGLGKYLSYKQEGLELIPQDIFFLKPGLVAHTKLHTSEVIGTLGFAGHLA